MIIAYKASPPENCGHMWADPKTRGTPPPGVTCPACDQRIDYTAINPNYKPPRSYYDLCATYDGDFLVSARLRDYLERRNLTGVAFLALPSSRRYFVLQCINLLELVRPPTFRMEEYCEVCKQYKSVYGINLISDPVRIRFENINSSIREGIYLSDLKMGYGPSKGPLLFVGVETWQGMVNERFKGIYARPIVN